ncbi:MAG TPA: hypothetical protein VGP07_06785 [Polyangia bacterium]
MKGVRRLAARVTLAVGLMVASAARAESTSDAFRYDPAAVESPRLRNVEPRTAVYLDAGYARSGDLSALPNIAGSAHGYRMAAGGSLKLGRFQLDVELPAGQVTTLDLIDPNPLFMIDPQDKHQTAVSLGDSRLGAQWTGVLPIDTMAVVAGFGVSLRVPTHTTRYTFHLTDGSPGLYVLPYYFNIQPTFLLGEALGPVSFVMNQSALILTGPDGTVADIPVVIPNIYFWDAHYGVSVRVADGFALSCVLNTTYQLNKLDVVVFPNLNKVRSAYLVPGAQVHVGAYRIDLVGRFGIKRGAEPLGVLTFAGTDAITLRVSRIFD